MYHARYTIIVFSGTDKCIYFRTDYTWWTPKRKRKRGRQRNTWRRTVEAEIMKWNKTWGTVEKMAKYRKEWRSFVALYMW
jgi:hypothetical protein